MNLNGGNLDKIFRKDYVSISFVIPCKGRQCIAIQF